MNGRPSCKVILGPLAQTAVLLYGPNELFDETLYEAQFPPVQQPGRLPTVVVVTKYIMPVPIPTIDFKLYP